MVVRKKQNRGKQWVALLTTLAVISIYSLSFAEGRAPLFVFSCWLQMTFCALFVMLEQPGDTLAPAKVASLLYTTSFAVAPLWLANTNLYHQRYYGNHIEDLMATTTTMTLVGFIFFLFGYFTLTRFRSIMPIPPLFPNEKMKNHMRLCMVAIGAVGMMFYAALIVQSGGIGRLLGYVGGRADIFGNIYGGWFWGMHFLFSAYGLFAVLTMRKHPWWSLGAAFLMAAAFVPLQGRDIVVAPIFCWLLFFHALRKPLQWPTIGAGVFCIILMASLLGAFRSGETRDGAGKFLSSYFERSGAYLANTVSTNIEQLDTAMTAVQYVNRADRTIGPMVLMSWAEPIDRAFLGDIIPSIYSGIFIDLLLFPEHKGWNTAASPSLPGELFIGMGWVGMIVGMTVYGVVFGQLTRWYARRYIDLILFAGYPFIVYMFGKMIVDGTTHLFRPIIVMAALYACSALAPKQKFMKIN